MVLEIALAIQALLGLCAFVGVVRWLVRQINAMKGAVKAQEKTIAAQAESMRAQSNTLQGLEVLLKSMQALLESTDETKMLARMKAYKEFVDAEKESAFKQYTEQSTTQMFDLFSQLITYVPHEKRATYIASTGLPKQFKDAMFRVAKEAPYIIPTAVSSLQQRLEQELKQTEQILAGAQKLAVDRREALQELKLLLQTVTLRQDLEHLKDLEKLVQEAQRQEGACSDPEA